MTGLPPRLATGAILAIAVTGLLGLAGYKIHVRATAIEASKWELKIGKQKLEAAGVLAEATKQRDDLQNELNKALAAQERKDDANQKVVASFESKLRAARVGSSGRMLDPNATGCGCGGEDPNSKDPGNAVVGGSDSAQAGRLLSAELTRLLDKLTREADDINVAYASCRADAITIRALIQQQ